jgi:signal transduction histidine kinase
MLQANGITQSSVNKDSLLNLLGSAKEDSNKVKLLIETGKLFIYKKNRVAEKYYKDAFELSKKIKYNEGIWLYYKNYMDLLGTREKSDSVINLGLEMLDWCKTNADSTKTGTALYYIGYAYMILNDNENAIKYFEESRSILKQHFGTEKIDGYTYYYLGLIANGGRQYRKSADYGLKAVEIFKRLGLDDMYSMATLSLGYNYICLKAYDSARLYLKICLGLAKKLNQVEMQTLCNLNFGYIYLLQRDFDKMKPYADEGLALSRKYGFNDYKSRSFWGLSVYYLSKKEYDLAKQYADSSFAITSQSNNSENRLRVLQHLSQLAFAMQDPILGYYYSDQYESLRDSAFNDNLQKMITSNEIKYETEKKEAQISLQKAALKQKSTLNSLLIAGSAALLIILLLTYRNYRHRQKLQQVKIDELQAEKQLTATEAVLKGEEQERTRLAKDLHDGLGGMLSGIKYSLSNVKENLIMTPDNMQAFERSIDMIDSSIREMRRVAHNLMPEMLLKYGLNTALKEFCNEVDRSGITHVTYQAIGMNQMEIEQSASVAIYRIVQELVNNAVKHAAPKDLLVQIHVSGREKLLTLTVEDNGKGFDSSSLKYSHGIGWGNIRNRVDFLKGKIDIHSEKDKGTSVLIEFNL